MANFLLTESWRRRINAVIAVVILLFGVGACVWLVKTSPEPPRRGLSNPVLEVAIKPIEGQEERSPVVAHGTVRPKHQVDIVPLVSGKLVEVHPNLAAGKTIPKGELLFQIDSTIYKAREQQASAEVRGLEAAMGRHDQELADLEERIATAEELLAIEERDFQSSKRLYEIEKVGTQRDVDLVYQKYLRQRDIVREFKSRKGMIPHIRLETQAKLDAARSQWEQTQHEMDNTRIVCPFRARVETVQAYRSQVVTAHFSIAKLTDVEAFEISVGINPRELRWLDPTIRPAALEVDRLLDGPKVMVSWSSLGERYTWEGRVTRFERVDEVTRTARMVVEIRNGEFSVQGTIGNEGVDAPLSVGMYCSTELPGMTLHDAMLVPRHAIYDNRWVYVFELDGGTDATQRSLSEPSPDDDRHHLPEPGSGGRLGRREITVLRSMGDHVLVNYGGREDNEVCELRAGEFVVVSPLLKPVEGMRIRVRNTTSLAFDRETAPKKGLAIEPILIAGVAHGAPVSIGWDHRQFNVPARF